VRPDAADEEIQLLTQRLTPGLAGYLVLIIAGLFARSSPSSGTWPSPSATSSRSGACPPGSSPNAVTTAMKASQGYTSSTACAQAPSDSGIDRKPANASTKRCAPARPAHRVACSFAWHV